MGIIQEDIVPKMILYGIDCGVNGGIAMLDGKNVQLFSFRGYTIQDMVGLFSTLFGCEDERFAMVERVHAMPSKFRGCSTSWTLAESFAIVRTLLAVNSVPYDMVLPETWQKRLSCRFLPPINYAKRKKLLRQKAQSLFPGVPHITEDTADALLIAYYSKNLRGVT